MKNKEVAESDKKNSFQTSSGPEKLSGYATVRLSPVERMNLDLINDPALEGFVQGGRSPLNVRVEKEGTAESGSDAPQSFEWGDFVASIRPDGVVKLEAYVGMGERAVIPAKVNGRSVAALEYNLFRGAKSLKSVVVESDSDCFWSDGLAVYSRDGRQLVQLAVCCDSYAIREGCAFVESHAFDSAAGLLDVEIPQSVRGIGSLAFAKSGLRSVTLPLGLEGVGDKAFFGCKSLTSCRFSDSVRRVGGASFAHSALERIVLPASLEHLGPCAFDHTPAQARVADGAISFESGNPHFGIDAQGGLYRHSAFAELVGRPLSYAVRRGTGEVLPGACRRNLALKTIALPEGVAVIGDEAFFGCKGLERVDLPASLEAIGARAFENTGVRFLSLGPRVCRIGESALLTQGENRKHFKRPLAQVGVSEDNPVLYVQDGVLCMRGAGDSGGDAGLLYAGVENVVHIPPRVNRILPYAFCGVDEIDELHVHANLHSVCRDAFSVMRSIPLLRIEYRDAFGRIASKSFRVPSLSARFMSYTDLVGTSGDGTVFRFDYYDSWVSHTGAIEEFAPAAACRLADPEQLSERAREVYMGVFSRKRDKACGYFAAHADIASLELLCDIGCIDRECVEAELARVTELGQAQAIGCLLELRRRMRWAGAVDLGL